MKRNDPYYDESMFKGAPSENFSKAECLRKEMTEAEKVLWEKLKDNRLLGYKFRRQHPIHLFIADFYCHKANLIIEVDGNYHESEEQKILDKERSELLEFQGAEIIRFTNKDILHNLNKVLKEIEDRLNKMR